MTAHILLIDVGNTRIKWHAHSARTPIHTNTQTHALPHSDSTIPIELIAHWRTLPTPDEVRISHVAQAPLFERLCALIHELWNAIPIVRIQAQPLHPLLQLNYDAAQMGSDRYAQLLGARTLYPADNIVVIAAGTAITVDAATSSGQHIGGIILPSMRLMRLALHQYTAQLPLEGGSETHLAPNNTQDALHTGSVFASVGAIDRFIHTYCAQLPVHILVCGGDAPTLIEHLKKLESLSHKQTITHAPSVGLLGLLAM